MSADEMQVVILCGGKGSRIYPFSEYFPKPMMPVNGRPILVHLMHIYARQGFQRFVLAAGHRKEMLHDYFDGRFPEWEIKILDTGAESDTADRIRACAKHVGERFFEAKLLVDDAICRPRNQTVHHDDATSSNDQFLYIWKKGKKKRRGHPCVGLGGPEPGCIEVAFSRRYYSSHGKRHVRGRRKSA